MDENKYSEFELNDNVLDSVTGGTGEGFSEFLCPCDGCDMDTTWQLSPDGNYAVCRNCGAVRRRSWYDENKIRRK